ncbi:MAG: NAD(P)H-binding protein [Actinobacteria bacterium]|nr:NAD(P)H-binding protein [Actinomycetota bacterium]
MILSGTAAPIVLVTGVRGKTGREVARQLAARPGIEIRGGSSAPGSVDLEGAIGTRFDWDSPDTWAEAVAGVDAVYLARPEIEAAPLRVAELLARLPGDAKVVLLSEMGAEAAAPSSWVGGVERAVRDGGRPWTILRPCWFIQILADERFNLDEIRDHGLLTLPSAGATVSFVDTRDIAAVAVEALLSDRHDGRTYTLSGPRAVTLDEIAALLSAARDRPVRYVDVTVAEAREQLARYGVSPWLVAEVNDVYERVCDGGFAAVTDDVRAVTGRPPREPAAFIKENARIWKS